MSTRNKIRLRKERVEIISLMKTTSYYKKQLIGFEKKLSRAYEENRIDKEKYLRRLNEGLQGRTLRQWLRYYDQCINVYNTRVVEIDRELRELEKSRNLLPILTIFAFVALLGLSYYFIQPAITGFTLIENGTNATESVFRIQLVNINISEETGIIETTEIENDRLIQVKAEINKPVEWKLITRNKTIELPLEASNIEVNKLINETEDIKEKARLKNQFGANNLNNKKLIEVDELNETKLEVTYYTKAPYSIESNLTQNKDLISKDITIKSDSELHYQNVLSYTEIPESKTDQINLYNYINNEKIEVTNNQLYNVSYLDLNNNGLIDKLVWYVPQLSEQNFSVEISLTILTLQSYPVVNSNWTVLFNTTGTAVLAIRASNGTTWSNDLNSTGTDLTFLELKCGTAIQNYQWLNNSVLISNYQCNETSQEISKVLTIGVHTIEFTFGNITKYAYNLANSLNLTLLSPANNTIISNNSVTLNISVENNATQVIIYAGNSSNLDYNNIVFLNNSIFGADAYNFTYNFTALPIKPQGDGSDGLVLLYHFDNISSVGENATNGSVFTVVDFSSNSARNNGTSNSNSSNGGPQFNATGGKFGGGFDFDGVYDRIRSNVVVGGGTTNTVTLTAWIKFKTISAYMAILENGGNRSGLLISGATGNPLTYYWENTIDEYDNATGLTLTIGVWHFVALVITPTSATVYLDGKTFTNTKTHNAETIDANWDVGSDLSVEDRFFNGTIDEVAIWNRSLSAKEISDLYNLNNRRYYWKANATDSAGNVNNTAIQEFNITLPPSNANTTITPTAAYKTSNINCSFTFTDPNPDDPGTGTIIFYNNSIEHFRTNISISAPGNNTIVSYTLTNNATHNFIPGSNITCAARTNDLMINSESWVNDSVLINQSLNTTLLQLANITNRINNSAELNVSIETGEKKVTELLIYAGNTTNLNYNNIIYRNTSISNFSEFNIT